MKKVILICIFTSLLNLCKAQITALDSLNKNRNDIKTRTVFFEVLGSGLLYSINYDRLLNLNKKIKNSITLGASFFINQRSETILALPMSYNFIFGKRKNHLEIGAGFSPFIFSGTYLIFPKSGNLATSNYSYYSQITDYSLSFVPKIGYRYQKPTGGFFFRFALTPIIGLFAYTTGSNQYDGFSYFDDTRGTGILPWAGISLGYTFKK